MSSPHRYLWVDLETSGLDPVRDHILEVGAMFTNSDLDEIGELFSTVVNQTVWPLMTPEITAMHQASGLLAELNASWVTAGHTGMWLWAVDQTLDDRMTSLSGGDPDTKWVLAGSGVGHFDLPFIRRHMPRVAARLEYWVLDIGVVRRFMRDVCGVEVPDFTSEKPHRALPDIRLHLGEARWMAARLRDEGFA